MARSTYTCMVYHLENAGSKPTAYITYGSGTRKAARAKLAETVRAMTDAGWSLTTDYGIDRATLARIDSPVRRFIQVERDA